MKFYFENDNKGNLLSCGQQLGILPPTNSKSNVIFAAKLGLSHKDPSQPGASLEPGLFETNLSVRRGRCDWPEERNVEVRGLQETLDNSKLSRDQLLGNNLL